MKSDYQPDKTTIAPGEVITLRTRFGDLSRGRCWGKYFPNKSTPTGDFQWVEKHGGKLYLSGPGFYVIGSNDGFNRKAQSSFELTAAAPAANPTELAPRKFDLDVTPDSALV